MNDWQTLTALSCKASEGQWSCFSIYPNPTAMQPLRHRINPKTFVITLRQIAKHLKIPQERILNWEKWHNLYLAPGKLNV